MARPTKLTPEVASKIIAFVRTGNYIEAAAAAAGIHKDTLYDWLKRGAPGNEESDSDDIYREFSDAVLQARAEAQIRAVAGLLATGHYKAWAWWLERSNPRQWGRIEYRGGAEDAENERDYAEQAKQKIIETLDRMNRRAGTMSGNCEGTDSDEPTG